MSGFAPDKIKQADHPLTSALVYTAPSGNKVVPKIYVQLGSGRVCLRRPKWIARWNGWHVYDCGWMPLSEDRSRGWQTEEAEQRRKYQEPANA